MLENNNDAKGMPEPDPYYSETIATFGDRLCAARDKYGLSQKQLAARMGITVRTLQSWENDISEPRANKLQMISALLNVSMVWLMSGLGNGVEPPDSKLESHDKVANEILYEIRSLREISQKLATKIDILEKKISGKYRNS